MNIKRFARKPSRYRLTGLRGAVELLSVLQEPSHIRTRPRARRADKRSKGAVTVCFVLLLVLTLSFAFPLARTNDPRPTGATKTSTGLVSHDKKVSLSTPSPTCIPQVKKHRFGGVVTSTATGCGRTDYKTDVQDW